MRAAWLLVAAWLLSCPDDGRARTGDRDDDRASRLRVAAVQYPIEGNQTVDQVLKKVEGYVRRAVEGGADLVVFPELLTLDAWPLARNEMTDAEKVRAIAEDVTPRFFDGVRAMAVRYGRAILAGSSPKMTDRGICNTAQLFLPDGREFRQDKLNLTAWEKGAGLRPGRSLALAETRWGLVAILICYDVEFPDLSARLIPHRPAIVLVPSMTESREGFERVRCTARARAVEHHAFVVLSSTVGQTSPNWRHFGQSAVISPHSKSFLEAEVAGQADRPDLVMHTLDLAVLAASRKVSTFYPAKDAEGRGEVVEVVIPKKAAP